MLIPLNLFISIHLEEIIMNNDQNDTNGNEFGNPAGKEFSEEFTAPSSDTLSMNAAEMESDIFTSNFGEDLIALKSEIETKLSANAHAATEAASVQSVEGNNIVGIGLTVIDAEDIVAGSAGMPGDPGLVLFTTEPVSSENLRAEIAGVVGTHALSETPIVQIPVGVVDAFSHRMRMRPAPGGISVGHHAVTAGTLGCLCTGNNAPRNQRLMILSNNHVLANTNRGPIGAAILQPGRIDGGRNPADQIAILERFIPINFSGGINYVDCATGWAWPDRVRRDLMYLSNGSIRFFRVGANPVAPSINMIVGKTGRTTQLTGGRVNAFGVSVNVNFEGRVAHFRDQIAIRGLNGNFSAPGDSGSLVWRWAAGLNPVGLLFAGGGGTTFANRITRVLSALDVRLVV
jgi:hypothetical protein